MIAEALGRAIRGRVIGEGDDYEFLTGGARTAAGETVTPETALKVSAVYACTSIIAAGIRQMPAEVVRGDGGGTLLPDRNNRLWSLLHDEPNPEQSAGEMWEELAWDAILRGNGFRWLERDSLGRVIALWPLRAGRVEITRDPRTRQKVFMVFGGDTREAVQWVGDTTDVLHVKGDPGPDPLRGVSVIHRLRETIGRALAEDSHAATTMKNQGRPSGILTVDGTLKDDAAERLVKRWNAAHGGARNSGRTAVLEGGAKWEKVVMSAADLELVKQRAISREDIAIAFRVPGDMVLTGDSGNLHYSTDATRDVRLVKYAIAPWSKRIEDALQACAALPWGEGPARAYPRFDPAGLLRADQKSRYEAYQIGLDAGFLTPDEARGPEGLPLLGLDKTKPLGEPKPAEKR